MFNDSLEPAGRSVIEIAAAPFSETLSFFCDHLGFRLDLISPADAPKLAHISGYGIALRLNADSSAKPPLLLNAPVSSKLAQAFDAAQHGEGASHNTHAPSPTENLSQHHPDPTENPPQPPQQQPEGSESPCELVSPSGVRLTRLCSAELKIPALQEEFVLSRFAADAKNWGVGRAGMRYRDLIPSRLGGRYIASHIEVCDGGQVFDLVHHHAIRFQMIFCHKGWVDLVYEDQGQPFRMHEGGLVLQPPHIRHRVLASSAGAQVVEIGCPAEHDTLFDYQTHLPTNTFAPEREFGGQVFCRHDASAAIWQHDADHLAVGWELCETPIESATRGLARVCEIRSNASSDELNSTSLIQNDDEFCFLFIRHGEATLSTNSTESHFKPLQQDIGLKSCDAVVIPVKQLWRLSGASADFRALLIQVSNR